MVRPDLEFSAYALRKQRWFEDLFFKQDNSGRNICLYPPPSSSTMRTATGRRGRLIQMSRGSRQIGPTVKFHAAVAQMRRADL